MSDCCKNRLKGKFKGVLDHPHHERPEGSRLDFMNPIPPNSMLTRFRPMFTRAPQVMGGGMSLACLPCTNKFIGSYPLSSGAQNVMQGADSLNMRDSTLYAAQNVCPMATVLMVCGIDPNFLSRLKFINMPSGIKMIYPLFPKDQIQVPYLQVVRTFLRE